MTDYLMIGTVLKPQGVRGECKIRPFAADQNLFFDWETLYLKDGESYTPLSSRVTRIHDGFVYAVLGGCASPEDAEKLRNRELYIDRAHAAPPEEGGVYIADLIGCRAVDDAGREIGILSDVLQHGSVDTWVFKTPSGSLMVPALLTVFPEVRPEEKLISVVSERLQEVAVFEN